ncbi:MAG: GNAT family N-acetyltransferase [Polyangiaceae bacterium]
MSSAAPAIEVQEARPEHAEALGRLFASSGYGCYCRYWHFGGGPREWQIRCAQTPELNAAEFSERFALGGADVRGLVALIPAGEIVGWLKLAPASTVQKVYDQRLYKGLPCFAGDRSGVFTIACVQVREGWRRRGVARALMQRAVDVARAWGARSIEAFPRRDSDMSDASLMMGPLTVFEELGFEVVRDFTPYPVLRKELGGTP